MNKDKQGIIWNGEEVVADDSKVSIDLTKLKKLVGTAKNPTTNEEITLKVYISESGKSAAITYGDVVAIVPEKPVEPAKLMDFLSSFITFKPKQG